MISLFWITLVIDIAVCQYSSASFKPLKVDLLPTFFIAPLVNSHINTLLIWPFLI